MHFGVVATNVYLVLCVHYIQISYPSFEFCFQLVKKLPNISDLVRNNNRFHLSDFQRSLVGSFLTSFMELLPKLLPILVRY